MRTSAPIWLFALWFPPPMEGGSAVYTYNLVQNLPAGTARVFTTSTPNCGDFDRTQSFPITRTWLRGTNPGKFRRVGISLCWLAMSIRRIFRRPAIVVAADLTTAAQVCMLISILFSIPYVIIIYSEELTTLMHDRSRGLWRQLDRALKFRALRGAAGFVGISDFALDQLTLLGIHNDRTVKIVPSVAPREDTTTTDQLELTRTRLALSHSSKVVLSVGRLVERKGHDQLIRAWPTVLRDLPDAKLVIVGRGEKESDLRALTEELGVSGSVVFAGYVSDDQLPPFFALCEVFVMPHRALPNGDTEGFGIVFLEANAHGRPVIGGNAGGVRDAIIDGVTGLIVDGNAADEIATAILSVLKDPVLGHRLGENGRRRLRAELCPKLGGQRFHAFLETWSSGSASKP